MGAQPPTGEHPARRAKKMKPLALGLDGCGVCDLQLLPPRLMEWLADLLSMAETLGRWPARPLESLTALVPKEGSKRQLERCWAGHRVWPIVLTQGNKGGRPLWRGIGSPPPPPPRFSGVGAWSCGVAGAGVTPEVHATQGPDHPQCVCVEVILTLSPSPFPQRSLPVATV